VYAISQVSYIPQTKGNCLFCSLPVRETLHSICKVWHLWIISYVYHVSSVCHGNGLNFRVVLLELLWSSPLLVSHRVSFSQRNAGPVIHRDSKNSLAFFPCEASSARFCFDSICFHWSMAVFSWISCTLLATNTWNHLLSLLMYPRTTLLLVQKYSQSMWYSSSQSSCWLIFTEHVSAVSSSLGIVFGFNGVTLDFPMTKRQWIAWCLSTSRK